MSGKLKILFIDDLYGEYIESLRAYEDYFNFKIYTAGSVEKGLDILETYPDLDAVILDLRFPRGQMQGEEGLKEIKKLYPYLPVFILTGADNKDEKQKLNECLRNGAEGYYRKDDLDIEKLLIDIGRAIQNAGKIRRLELQKKYKGRHITPPLLKFSSDKKTGYFGFILADTILTESVSLYYTWSRDLLDTLQLAGDKLGMTQLIHAPAENGKINVYVIFAVRGEDEEDIRKIFEDVLFDLSYFFYEKSEAQPGIFQPISSSSLLDMLIELLQRKDTEEHWLIKRKVITKDKSAKPGFKKDTKEENKLKLGYPINPLGFDFSSMFLRLAGLGNAFIRIDVNSVRLEEEESETLKKLRSLAGNSKAEQTAITDLWMNKEALFHITTTLFAGKEVPYAVLQAIGDVYYNGLIDTQKIKREDYKEIEEPFERFPYLYSSESGAYVFQLPYFKDKNVPYFSGVDLRELKIPLQALKRSGILVGRHYWGNIYIDPKQFQKHTYIIGKTGTGKTSVLYRMFMDRVEAGQGVALIDPHGDIFQKIRRDIPDSRKQDVVIFDPTDPDNHFAFNYLSFDKNFPEHKTFLVDELMKIFEEIYDMKSVAGPNFEMYFRNYAYLIMNTLENPTLNDLIKVFEDISFRNELIKKCKDQKLKSRIKTTINVTGDDYSYSNFVLYVTSKLTRFVDNYYLDKVINDKSGKFDFREMIDSQKIFLVHLNKGKLGDLGVNFIGRLLFNKIIMAAYSRSDIPEEERKDFTLFVDEFQNFTSRDIVTALGETRKYRLQLVLANQTFAQLDDKTARNILSNVGSIITAAVSPFDAEMIIPFLKPDFTDLDLIKLDNYKFILKTLYNNKQVDPIIFESIPY